MILKFVLNTQVIWIIFIKSDNPYRILITEGSGSGKTNSLLNLRSYQPDIDKTYLYAKDSYEAKYQLLINQQKSTGLKHLNDSKTFVEYLNEMDDIYEILKKTNQTRNA